MRGSNEPLLSSASPRNASASLGKPLSLLITLLSATLLGVIAVHLLSIAAPDLCAGSPAPASCNAIVADAVLTSPRGGRYFTSRRQRPAQVLRAIVARSLAQHDAAAAAVAGMHRRASSSDPRLRAALADCVQLMDLARDRVADASAAAADDDDDARTWLSAALTYYMTCTDGVGEGPLRDAVGARLEPLKSLASASLAVLNAVGGSRGGVLAEVVVDTFPSWVPARDRALLEQGTGAWAVNADVVVAQDGSGKYRTVKEAVDAAPDGAKRRYVIYVKKGVYKENVEVGKKKRELMIVGDGMDATVITGSRNVIDGATTFNSATLAVTGDGIILQDLRVENTAGPEKHQAVALRVSADRAVAYRCRVDGYQDTLYAHALRHFYRECSVSGTVDFVFGNAAAVLQGCALGARLPLRSQKNAVTAQGRTDPNQNTGTSIHRCRVVPAPDLAPVAGRDFPTFLGRPWKEYSRTVYMQSYLDAHVDPKGWLEWDGDFALSTLFYGEYQNEGPGAGTAARVTWPGYHVITDRSVAVQFTVGQFIKGGSWLNGTGVNYIDGL
ncbi:Pectinesterase 2.2 [Dichanthelium oligosanthes]|uniref:Pectinesterase n=1 Tax=Dichanthelium oligosanthes TaxID=888268 RepID=A0A1E5VMW3_9POAL|nr:Pectinesterase 2.2 [Dichanthelium oligosanthes]